MSTDTSSHAPEGPLPAVHDEAQDTPNWIPVTGLVLFLFLLLSLLYRAGTPEVVEAPEAPAADEAAEAPAANE